MTRFTRTPAALAVLAILLTSGCLLRETGDCPEGSNPKEHACRAPARYYPPSAEDDAGTIAPPSSCGPALDGDVDSYLPSGASRLRGSCGGDGPESSFVYTARRSGLYTFETLGADFDTVLYVLSGPCTGSELACDDDSGGGTASRVTVDLRASERVTVVVDAYGSSGGGIYRLQVLTP